MTALANDKSSGWWALLVLCALLGVAELWLASRLLFGDSGAAHYAVEDGRRVWVDAKNGSVTGQKTPAMPAQTDGATEQSKPAPKADPAKDLMSEFAASEAETAAAKPAPMPEPAKPADAFVGNESELRDIIPAEPRTAVSLAPPEEALLEQAAEGALPMRDGERAPFDVYRRPFTPPTGNRPAIALLVTGLGPIRAQSEAATQLPKDVTLAFSAYANHTPAWLGTARNRGFESWLMLPAQPDSFPAGDGGPNALLVEQDAGEALTRLKRVMATTQGYAGLVLPAGEVLSDHLNRMSWLQKQTGSRGLALIAADRPGNSATQGWFRKTSGAHAAEVLIDAQLNAEAIARQLKALEVKARQQGRALGVIRAYPLSLKLANEWAAGLKARGFVLAPASAILANDDS